MFLFNLVKILVRACKILELIDQQISIFWVSLQIVFSGPQISDSYFINIIITW